jgi:hypothetical protein
MPDLFPFSEPFQSSIDPIVNLVAVFVAPYATAQADRRRWRETVRSIVENVSMADSPTHVRGVTNPLRVVMLSRSIESTILTA